MRYVSPQLHVNSMEIAEVISVINEHTATYPLTAGDDEISLF